MTCRKIMEDYYNDINNLSDFLAKLVNSYRLIVGGAGELNGIALAHKKDVKKAIKTSNDLLKVINEVICMLEKTSCGYIDYCQLRAQIVESRMQAQYIQTEIDNELKLQNSQGDTPNSEKDTIINERDLSHDEKDDSNNEKEDSNKEKDIQDSKKDIDNNEEDSSNNENNDNGKEV
ncbi:hypothetical protein Ccar_21990 [Clostridium carboxidivorans P7]|uniref:Uncharacterized protein n=1 Tax=Clostridium carboxidivorans P7 TaxID=536227 RepID=C6PZH5_9CLOT|nr:hypothetical protein [Clostridium carboxidivorans]AKN33349.1 hypothetical protein Ccar_21990 [Clostridium carboxidivorans P7]EET85364.1 hypothetical protein CcarbDRAFT_4192 [Clostridium carboxidivorans P7]EFG89276.1 hypothetical protein CLCAR_1162 [Clostridium carboxidivorans P7]